MPPLVLQEIPVDPRQASAYLYRGERTLQQWGLTESS